MQTERFQEIVLGGVAILWGALLLLPDDVFGRVQAYSVMSRFLPDWAWGVLLILCGLALLTLMPLRRVRKEAHAALSIVWSFIVLLAFSRGISVGAALVAIPFVAMALLHIFEFLRLSQLAKL